jgi:hypothetical protein
MSIRMKVMLAAAIAAAFIPLSAQAQWWQHHPRYVHAMSYLRQAYWLIQHREANDPVARPEEVYALHQIGAAYNNLKTASIIDEKDINDQPPANFAFGDHRGRLHHARDLLGAARNEIQGEEDDPAARGFRARATLYVDNAIRATNNAIRAWMF